MISKVDADCTYRMNVCLSLYYLDMKNRFREVAGPLP